MQDDIKPVLTDEEILAVGAFGPSPLKRLEHGRAIEQAVLRVLATREGREPWQPIETAPRDGCRVLVWHPAYTATLSAQWYGEAAGGWRLVYELPPLKHQPTHWQPLPAPPADAQRAKGE